MSTLLSAHSLGYDTACGPLLTDVSLSVSTGERIGLIGDNGSGKSTLLDLLSGVRLPATGGVTLAGQCLMARVEQHLPAALYDNSLLTALIAGLPPGSPLPEPWQAGAMLERLGFAESSWQQTAGTLSGGQHTRLLLARALIRQPDLLLLDEPGNHLDLPTLLWLERFLLTWRGSFVLVSHDRRLLDNVTNTTWVLRDRGLRFIGLPCSAARVALAQQDAADAHRRQAEQNEIDRVSHSARRLALWGSTYDNEKLARKAKQMEKQVERLTEEQTRVSAGSRWRLQLTGEALPADRLLALDALRVRPDADGPLLFSVDALQVKSGDRVAITGRNGGGKSSLLRTLWHAWQSLPAITPGALFHPSARVGYYDQNLRALRDDDTLSGALEAFTTAGDVPRRQALIAAGFPYVRHQQRVRTLSGGERARLLFVGLSLAGYALLLLDEPTNHLDLEGKEQLAQALEAFSGAVLLVTHDRALIEQSCNRYWTLAGQRLSEWHDTDAAWAALAEVPAVASAPDSDNPPLHCLPSRQPLAQQEAIADDDEERWLAALLVLEAKLAEDRSRRLKHQKPTLQRHWMQEIARLNALLGL